MPIHPCITQQQKVAAVTKTVGANIGAIVCSTTNRTRKLHIRNSNDSVGSDIPSLLGKDCRIDELYYIIDNDDNVVFLVFFFFFLCYC